MAHGGGFVRFFAYGVGVWLGWLPAGRLLSVCLRRWALPGLIACAALVCMLTALAFP